jgi:hypothetical protein
VRVGELSIVAVEVGLGDVGLGGEVFLGVGEGPGVEVGKIQMPSSFSHVKS